MKTSRQIRKWIYTKPWAWRFVKNVLKTDDSMLFKKKVLSGEYGSCMIMIGFCWADTKEGESFWNIIYKDFCKWYDNENV